MKAGTLACTAWLFSLSATWSADYAIAAKFKAFNEVGYLGVVARLAEQSAACG